MSAKKRCKYNKAISILVSLFLVLGNGAFVLEAYAEDTGEGVANEVTSGEEVSPDNSVSDVESVAGSDNAGDSHEVSDGEGDAAANSDAGSETDAGSESDLGSEVESKTDTEEDTNTAEGAIDEAALESDDVASSENGESVNTEAESAEGEEADAVSEVSARASGSISAEAKGESMAAEKNGSEYPAGIYLDPVNGKDENSGSHDDPVKTFEKAKSLVMSEGLDVIYVMNPIPGKGSMALPSGKVLKRAPGYKGALINVESSDTLDLKEITIDGDETQISESAMIMVRGVLNVMEGALLRNNKRDDSHANDEYSTNMTKGGAIYVAYRGVMNFLGGIIEKNYSDLGGGVYVGGTMNMEGGEIRENTAKDGGAIHVGSSGVANLKDGLISTNRANRYGGGISVGGSNDYGGKPRLNMTGGVIDNNRSGRAGGGIFIQANSKGVITKGIISNNRAMSSNILYMEYYAGGGIYVNGGYTESPYNTPDGVLELGKVYISDNGSREEGGGIANCPSSTLSIYMSNGLAMAGNYQTGIWGWSMIPDDFYIASGVAGWHHGTPTMYASSIMLGGEKNAWTYRSTGTPFEYIDQEYTMPDYSSINLVNLISADALARGFSKADVFIIGNRAVSGKGGGIGSNGIINIGVEKPEYGSLTVSKTVTGDEIAKGKDYTFTVTLDYKITGTFGDMDFKDGVATFTLKDGESKTATGLIPDIEYTVTETTDRNTTVSYKTGNTGVIVPNEQSLVEAENKQVVYLEGQKIWKEDSEEERPESITVRLLADGEEVNSAVVSAETDWTFSFENLPKYNGSDLISYTVTEDEVSGYEVEYGSSIDAEGNTFYEITNTKLPPPPDVPETPGEPPTPPDVPETPGEPPTPPKKPEKPVTPPPTKETPKKVPEVPATGDDANAWIWLALMGVGAYGLIRVCNTSKKKV